jgi:hypothetical protein
MYDAFAFGNHESRGGVSNVCIEIQQVLGAFTPVGCLN